MKKKIKRRLKKLKEKQATETSKDEENAISDTVSNRTEETLQLGDVIEIYNTIHLPKKVRGCVFSPLLLKDNTAKVLFSYLDNSLDVYHIKSPTVAELPTEDVAKKFSSIDYHGHRGDVRGICVAHDGLSLVTCSSEGVKVWSTKTFLCIRSCRIDGYCLCVAFAPGGRYVAVGTKEGTVLVRVTTSISFLLQFVLNQQFSFFVCLIDLLFLTDCG